MTPTLNSMIAKDMGVKHVKDVDELYAKSDFISLHAIKTDETQEMINAEAIDKMKDGGADYQRGTGRINQ